MGGRGYFAIFLYSVTATRKSMILNINAKAKKYGSLASIELMASQKLISHNNVIMANELILI